MWTLPNVFLSGTWAEALAKPRWEVCLSNPWACLGAVLDPGLKPKLPPEIISRARSYAHNTWPAAAAAFDAYVAGPLDTKPPEGDVANWWKAGLRCGWDPVLVDVALNCCAARGSTADLERAFSTFSSVYAQRTESFCCTTCCFFWRGTLQAEKSPQGRSLVGENSPKAPILTQAHTIA